MILGRPADAFLAIVTSGVGFATLIAAALGYPIPPEIAGALLAFLGAIIAFVANQPPTLQAGDTYTIATPKGQPNYEATVAPPPAPTTPTVEVQP